jgi:hypothetical protein
MHLIERYSLSSGLKIDNPSIQIKYFPLLCDNFVCFHASSKDDPRNYDYWKEVKELIRPTLEKNNLKTVQVGIPTDPDIQCDFDFRGQTSIGQMAYVISKCSFFIGVDSFPAHIAGFFKKKMIGLYCNSFPECAKPYWGDFENQIILTPPRKQHEKPSFSSSTENPKSINKIKPEQIANSFHKLIGEEQLPFETIFVGQRFHQSCVDVVPDTVYDIRNESKIHVRMDLAFNEFNLSQLMQQNFVEVTTTRPINEELLKIGRINIINYVSDSFDKNFVELCKKYGISLVLLATSNKNLCKERALLFDETIHEFFIEDIMKEKESLINSQTFKVKSNKKIFFKNRVFDSYFSAFNGVKNKYFYLDLDWYYVYND